MPIRVLGLQQPQNAIVHSSSEPQPRAKKGLKSVLGFSRASSAEPRPSPSASAPASAAANSNANGDPTSKGTTASQGSFSPSSRPRTLRERRSVDVSNAGSGSFTVSLSYRRKASRNREGRASVSDISFFSADPPPLTSASSPSVPTTPTKSTHTPVHSVNLNSPEAKQRTMPGINDVPQERASRRKLARIEAQDGPWSVSVAESPYDKNSYSLYIKSAYL